jgi:AraC-like DNA-binding protein
MTFHTRNLVLQNVLELARSYNVETPLVLAACGLRDPDIARDQGLVPTLRVVQVLEQVAALSRRNDFGLKWGERADYRSFGALGLAIRHETTMGRALARTGHYLRQLNVGQHFTLHRAEAGASLVMCFPVAEGVPARHYREGSALLIVRFARFLSSGQWNPRLVRFTHPRLAGPYAYEKAFGCPVLFDQDQTTVETDNAALARRLVFEESPVHAMTLQVLEDMQGEGNVSLPARIAGMLPQLLPAGRATTAHIASLLNMSPRTLQRRLSDHGTSLRQIVNSQRYSIVQQQIDAGLASGRNLASALGYTEPSAASRFIRARIGRTRTQLEAAARRPRMTLDQDFSST